MIRKVALHLAMATAAAAAIGLSWLVYQSPAFALMLDAAIAFCL